MSDQGAVSHTVVLVAVEGLMRCETFIKREYQNVQSAIDQQDF